MGQFATSAIVSVVLCCFAELTLVTDGLVPEYDNLKLAISLQPRQDLSTGLTSSLRIHGADTNGADVELL